jgi:predicted transcriptional regulator
MKTEKTHEHDQSFSKKNETSLNFKNSLRNIKGQYENEVIWMKPSDTVINGAKLMAKKHIGNIIIAEERDGGVIPIGIVTDRDILIKAMVKNTSFDSMKLKDVMTDKIITSNENADLSDLVHLMTSKGICRIPIVDDSGFLKGILTSKTIYQYFAQNLSDLSNISVQQHERECSTH